MDWELAACRDHDPELFFPVGTEGPGAEQLTAAKFICGTCPLQAACLRWALDTGQEAGVWGGTSEEDRRDMRRARLAGRSLGVSA
ncbi:WhiB family transcriptional regulator [Actinomycetospora corticicola]|uniref:Transcriptional regulator WhiB n=1 Tax=Actinomycetospora corticicola TaxID=663602 RepID=A0A7Y9J490_9PSEU|nr:WhiB family transcriptional regulator [Actinomycetospora corticicola]NYD34853.1 WhiB family redox-sensing transcriptional regulator [Actinomycetospora corticicola]